MAIPIGTLGTIPTLEIAGRVFTDLTNLIMTAGRVGTNANVTLRKYSGSAGYQVTTGKTFTAATIRTYPVNAAAAATFGLVQSDNDVGIDSATAFTNPVYELGDSAAKSHVWVDIAASDNVTNVDTTNFQVAALKYLSAKASTGAVFVLQVCGYES